MTLMGGQENKDIAFYIISKLRSITRMVQLAPFVYAFFYTIVIGLYQYASYETAKVLDVLFYVSPVAVIINLIESRILNLCKWHKTACLLPILPQLVILIDNHIIRFSISAARLTSIVFLIMLFLFLVSAYQVFFNNERKQNLIGNSRILQVPSRPQPLHDGRNGIGSESP